MNPKTQAEARIKSLTEKIQPQLDQIEELTSFIKRYDELGNESPSGPGIGTGKGRKYARPISAMALEVVAASNVKLSIADIATKVNVANSIRVKKGAVGAALVGLRKQGLISSPERGYYKQK
jgi:hypothetical protein